MSRSNELVCVGFAEALSAPEVVWSLVDAGYRVAAFARRGRRSPLRHSRYVEMHDVTAPEMDSQAALAELAQLLADLGTRNRNGVVMGLDDAAIWLCARVELPITWLRAGADNQLIRVALDKDFQTRAAITAGFNVPETALATTKEDVLAKIGAVPIVLKPACAVWEVGRRLNGGRHRTCATVEELQRAAEDWNGEYPVLIQPFIRGAGEGVFGIATTDGISGWSAHKRIRMVNPQGSGSSACASAEVPSELKSCIEKFVSDTGWRGIFMVEFLRDDHGTPWFVEFNGRPWGSMALSRRRGFEYPAWNVDLVARPPWRYVGPANSNKGVTLCRHIGRECVHLLFVLRGPRSTAYKEWPSFWRSLWNVLNIRRQDGIYNWRKDDKAVFFADWWYTVRQSVARGLKH